MQVLGQRRVVTLITTPKELRELADEMEVQWKGTNVGDSCYVKTITCGDLFLEISIDHTTMNLEEEKTE